MDGPTRSCKPVDYAMDFHIKERVEDIIRLEYVPAEFLG